MMARYNPELMQLDDGTTGAPRIFSSRNTAPKITEEELAAENAKFDPATGMPLDLLESDIPEIRQSFTQSGFTPGPYPKEFEQFFGVANPNMLGYKIITNEDGSQQLEVQTGPGSTSTFGFKFGKDNTGTYVPFKTSSGSGGSGGSLLGTGAPSQFGPGSEGYDKRKSAYDLLYEEFDKYGLSALVTPIKDLIMSGTPGSEFTIKLRETEAYKKRFSANAERIGKGLKAIDEATYLGLEDQYQNIMRNYGLPAEYYARGEMGIQEGFNKFIANDVSAPELEDRIMTAQSRVLNSNPEVLASLKSFYPDITNGDILAYTLDPTKGLMDIKRKITAAEIGGGAMQAGLGISGTRAEELTAAGITKAQAQQGYGTIGSGLQRGSQLASIYGESPYTQTTAEKEVFGLAGKTEAEKERKKLTGLEKANFGGQSGISSGALTRDRAGGY